MKMKISKELCEFEFFPNVEISFSLEEFLAIRSLNLWYNSGQLHTLLDEKQYKEASYIIGKALADLAKLKNSNGDGFSSRDWLYILTHHENMCKNYKENSK